MASINGIYKYEYAMEDLTAFQRDVLYIIAGLGEPHGLAIKEEIEKYYDKEVHHGDCIQTSTRSWSRG